MKEHKLPPQSFIKGYYIDPKICDDIVEVFKGLPKLYKLPGEMYSTQGKILVQPECKDSLDFQVKKGVGLSPFREYDNALQECLEKYVKEYPEMSWISKFNVVEPMNVQYYKPGGGFKVWHCERLNPYNMERVLVFMTYLNDVPDGGTEFRYQNLITPAKKGLTVLWPPDWHHTHRGQISQKHEKYIITGWYGLETVEKRISII